MLLEFIESNIASELRLIAKVVPLVKKKIPRKKSTDGSKKKKATSEKKVKFKLDDSEEDTEFQDHDESGDADGPKKKKMTAREREELLIENFVGLQHAMTNLSVKFGSLSDNISKLLQVFEEAAKNFVSGGKSDDKDMLNKINSLLDQNKTIAKGLVLMEGKLRGRSEAHEEMPSRFEGERPRPKLLRI